MNKESDNFAIDSFQMLKLPQSLHSLSLLYFQVLEYLIVFVVINLTEQYFSVVNCLCIFPVLY